MLWYYNQYKKLFHETQTDKNKGKYKVFLFDVKNSKSHVKNDRDFRKVLFNLVGKITQDLLKLEKVKGHKILHRHILFDDLQDGEQIENKVAFLKSQADYTTGKVQRTDQINPLFWLGDTFHFIIERDAISDKEFMQIFQHNKDMIAPNYDFYFASGYYETDVWLHSTEQFSRVYCLPVLGELAKKNKNMITSPKKITMTQDKEI